MCCTTQALVGNNKGTLVEKLRAIWDRTTRLTPEDVVANDQTPTKDEAEITFGMVKVLFYWMWFTMRVSFPEAGIFLVLADIKACFRFQKIHPDLTGAFGFLVNDLYCLATAMVFGSNTSASSWEPFRRAIEGLSMKLANRPVLVKKKQILS